MEPGHIRRWLSAGVAAEILPVRVSLTPFTAIFTPLGIRYRDKTIECGMVLQSRDFERIGFILHGWQTKLVAKRRMFFPKMLPPTFIY
ncbi:hypothetical protein J2Z49_002445 [Desulfofundulus luciae]|uniref:Uncharacterized protein n=1 Tax=Desulfofundulus luciae TaxID=74702 RepID=A0ABU0B3M5_9FIRM|nr:hypothetical protein [Desulfofundulus luciae]MDQ0287324.1 hypothetical protein [Desulfofundulus luciae]